MRSHELPQLHCKRATKSVGVFGMYEASNLRMPTLKLADQIDEGTEEFTGRNAGCFFGQPVLKH
jgi:hypothetical protein